MKMPKHSDLRANARVICDRSGWLANRQIRATRRRIRNRANTTTNRRQPVRIAVLTIAGQSGTARASEQAPRAHQKTLRR
jgi:hypothetical protein